VAKPLAVLLPLIQSGKVPMWLVPNPADYPDPADFLPLVPPGYWAGWFNWKPGQDPTFDSLANAAMSATSLDPRKSAYQALDQASNEANRNIFIAQGGRTLVAATGIQVQLNPFDYVDLGSVT
jgi:ABC-type transport system substrate-binding protein